MRRYLMLALVSACVGAVVTSGALAVSTEDRTSARPAAAPPVKAVPEAVSDKLAAFRRLQRPSDAIPGDPVAALEDAGDRQAGENPLLARRLDLDSGGEAFVWPMSGGVCFSSPGPMGCVDTSFLRRQGAVISTAFESDTPLVQAFGLAIDGVETVELELRDGARVTARIRGGAFFVELPSDPLSATWAMPDGSTRTQKPLVIR